MRFSELVEHVSKKPIPPWKKHLLVEVTVTDEEGEDVEVSGAGYQRPTLLIDYFRCRSSSYGSEWCRGHVDWAQFVGTGLGNRGCIMIVFK